MFESVNVVDNYFHSSRKDKPFKLTQQFISSYSNVRPKFGFNGLGELTYYRTYSRLKDDGSKESFLETVTRIVEGTYDIQRKYCKWLNLPFDIGRAQDHAQEMFERMWAFKWLPPGRGMWIMGTPFMYKSGGAALNNCGFVSTDDDIESDPSSPFAFAMDMLMLGVGIGFDTKGAGKVPVVKPNDKSSKFLVEDSREGWVAALSQLIRSYTIRPDLGKLEFDLSSIRPKGSPIKGFGGQASGPSGLQDLLSSVNDFLGRKVGTRLSSVDITDLMNMVGKCVVAGNVRRSAEIAFGDPNDPTYVTMKNPTLGFTPEQIGEFYKTTDKLYKEGKVVATINDFNTSMFDIDKLTRSVEVWNAMNDRRWASNNSILSEVGMDYTEFGHSTAVNGEPGYIWLDNMRDYGRMKDGRVPGIDGRVKGSNPCFSGNMLLLTNNGYEKISDLWEKQGCIDFEGHHPDMLSEYGSQNIINDNGTVKATKIYRTGFSPLFKVTFNDGSHIEATSNHEFILLNKRSKRIGGKKRVVYCETRRKLCDLKVGDLIPLNNSVCYGIFHEPAYAELAGWCIGDGSLHECKDNQLGAICTTYESDIDNVLPRLRCLMFELFETHSKSRNSMPSYAGWQRNFDDTSFEHDEVRLESRVLGRMLKDDGINKGDKHIVPKRIFNGTKLTIAAFIRGLASADGYCNITKDSISVRIWQSNCNFLQQCRLLLNQIGITSTVQFRRKERTVVMNDGKGGVKEYVSKPGYELIISGIKQVTKFLNDIGFIQDWKYKKALDWLNVHSGSNNSDTGKYVSIVNIEQIADGYTYCLTEPNTNQVVINGYKVGQCVEQSLESYELCVSSDTMIQTKTGIFKIIDIVGKEVEVWNGEAWSKVTPRQTGSNRLLRKVTLSDGSTLLATPNHKWSIKNKKEYSEVETDSLMHGDILETFSLPVIDSSGNLPQIKKSDDKKYVELLGRLAAGDNTVRAELDTVYKQEFLDSLAHQSDDLPSEILTLGTELSAMFLHGWAVTRGIVSVRENLVVLLGSTNRLRSAQLIARRAQQNNTLLEADSLSVNSICGLLAKICGGKTAKPTKCEQHVVSVDAVAGTHDTYCFSESKRHRGVFNNVLTHQCNLVETFPVNNVDEADYMRTIKFAYLYGKTVTLIPTHCDRTNRVMLRNRRIGLSQSGIVQGFEKFGRRRYLNNFCDAAYSEIRRWDNVYSEYFACRQSIKVTSVKPSGTVSLIAGVTPGIHFPEARTYWRRIRLAADSSLIPLLRDAGYEIEPDLKDPHTMVVKFGIEDIGVRPITDVSIWEQMDNVAALQHYWADNAVSVTIQFDQAEEAKDIPKVLEHYEDRIKAVSFLPHSGHGYAQAPYESANIDDVKAYNSKIRPIDFSSMTEAAVGDKYCTTDRCTIN